MAMFRRSKHLGRSRASQEPLIEANVAIFQLLEAMMVSPSVRRGISFFRHGPVGPKGASVKGRGKVGFVRVKVCITL